MSGPAPLESAMVNFAGAAQPSFAGQGWLVALNLGVMTAGFFLCVMLTWKLGSDIWRCRYLDRMRDPVTVVRLMVLCFAAAGSLRFGGEAAALWGWDPHNQAATLAAAQAKRILDPVAAPLAWLGFGIWVLSEVSLVAQLRRQPPRPIVMWPKLHHLKRPTLVVALSFIAAIGVVSTR